MTEEQQGNQPRPSDAAIIQAQQRELAYVLDRLVFQQALVDEVRAEAVSEIAMRDSRIKALEEQIAASE